MFGLENLTTCTALAYPQLDLGNCTYIYVCLADAYALPSPGRGVEALRTLDEPAPLPEVDLWLGEPGSSSLRMEGQLTPGKPQPDIYITASAFPPSGRPASSMMASFQLGDFSTSLHIFGPRRWLRRVGRLRPSKPEPTGEVPLVYERAFGGVERAPDGKVLVFEDSNPVGVGCYGSARSAIHQPLPQIENPRWPTRDWQDRPIPAGWGPIHRSWSPRRVLAGTFDERWTRERAPLWPGDFNPRFFQGANPSLIYPEPIKGGEAVRLTGVHPDGPLTFNLPYRRPQLTVAFKRRQVLPMVADGIWFNLYEGTLTLFWRTRAFLLEDCHHLKAFVLRWQNRWEGK